MKKYLCIETVSNFSPYKKGNVYEIKIDTNEESYLFKTYVKLEEKWIPIYSPIVEKYFIPLREKNLETLLENKNYM